VKNLLIILSVLIFSCSKQSCFYDTTWKLAHVSKEPGASERISSYKQVRCTNHDTAEGLSFTVFVKNIKGGGSETAIWGSMTFPNGVWFQFGYWQDCRYVSMLFNRGTYPVTYRNVAPVPILSKNQYHTFKAEHIGGGIWQISVDGLVFNEFDFGSWYITTKSFAGEITYSSKQPTFPNIHAPEIKIKSGEWKVSDYAVFQGTGWGIIGSEQDNNLKKG
jgi:hypothetical protein